MNTRVKGNANVLQGSRLLAPFITNRSVFLVMAFIVIAGAGLIHHEIHTTDRAIRQDLLNQTRRAAESLNVQLIQQLRGMPDDLEIPAYQRIKSTLMLLRKMHDQCRFVYLMGQRPDGKVFFMVDSESPESEDYSPPGQVYEEADDVEASLFAGSSPVVTGPTPDRWGVWVTAYVPIINPRTHEVVALFGMDIDASDWHREVWKPVYPTGIFILLIGVLVLVGAIAFRMRARHEGRKPAWMQYLEPVLIVIAGMIITFYVAHNLHEQDLRERYLVFEQLAQSETEHIAGRIQHLRDAHLMSLTRFVEASDSISWSEFNHFTEALMDDAAIYAWAWMPRVEEPERSNFITRAAAVTDNAPSDIWEKDDAGLARRAIGRDVYYPILYVSPIEGNEAAIGFDQLSEARRRSALLEAVHAALPTATPPLSLIHLDDLHQGLIIYQGVRNGSGVVAVVMSMHAVIPARSSGPAVRKSLHLLTSSSGDLPVPVDAFSVTHRNIEIARPIAAFNHLFWIVARPDEDFVATGPLHVLAWALGVGSVLTLAVAFIIGIPIHRREELHHLVVERTKALKESESTYRLLTESMKDVVWSMDAKSLTYTYLSPSLFTLLGYSPDELLGKPAVMTSPGDRASEHQKLLSDRAAEAVAGKYSPEQYFLDEMELQKKDGTRIWTEISSHFVTNPRTGRYELQGVTRDTSARRQALAALRENQRFLSDLIENSGTLIYVKDRAGVYQMVNHRWEVVTGLDRAQVLGRTDSEIFSRVNAENFQRLDKEVMDNGVMVEEEETLEHASELRHFISVKFPLLDAAGNVSGLCGMSTEITEQKKAEERILQHVQELEGWHNVTLGREQRVLELKIEVNDLLGRLGEPKRYDNV